MHFSSTAESMRIPTFEINATLHQKNPRNSAQRNPTLADRFFDAFDLSSCFFSGKSVAI